MNRIFAFVFTLLLTLTSPICAADPILIADFEGSDYGTWKTTGTAFGTSPAAGTLSNQMRVEGYNGKQLVNSYHGGDNSKGTLTSPRFKIERKFITFLIGGGGWANETCMNLEVDGKVVRTAAGPNTRSGGSERLAPAAWDVIELANREATIVIVDQREGGWGHINVDDIFQTDTRGDIPLVKPPVPLVANASRKIVASKRWLRFPVKNGATNRVVTVRSGDETVRRFDIELADDRPDWWAPMDVRTWLGKELTVTVDALPADSEALKSLQPADEYVATDDLYREPLRPQLQFSPRRGWTNDPNGLAYYNGEYHLFFQHNPYGWSWGNMHWGHATSRDLVHWQEHGDALFPDSMGPMFSGSAVVDWKNTSGLGQNNKNEPPLVLFYTAAGNPTVQCLAYSTDGRTFTKFPGNPIIQQITPGNRDPKVIWHEPTKHWVLTLYVGLPNPDGSKDANGRPTEIHTIHFFTSTNLKDWKLQSQNAGLFECPDFFELPLEGDGATKKWILTGASSEYFVGTFDGQRFTAETTKLPGHRGRGFYAAQTYSDTPDGRRIQIGWGQMPSPGMSFNQLLTIPCELTLRGTNDGPRLRWQPIQEMESLRKTAHRTQIKPLAAGGANPLSDVRAELLEIRADFEPAKNSEVVFNVRGVEIRYNTPKREIQVAGITAPAPLFNGRQKLIIITDRTSFTIWAGDGLTYIPVPVIAKPADLSAEVSVTGDPVPFHQLDAYELKSIW